MQKYFHFFAYLLLFTATKAQTPAPVLTDGPYVGYENGQVYVKTIRKDDDLLVPVSISYAEAQKVDLTLDVVPEGRPDWGFKVKLKQVMDTGAAVYPANDKTLFISDIEGEFAPFRKMLLAAKVIDAQYSWTYGQGSLVIAGDLFDRGKDVVPELWLLYKLEDEAKAAGGSVHVLLGNHDIMNLSGDHRYTDPKYFKNAWLLGTDCSGLFGKDTELGRWLRSKNIIEKIGDVLAMHGGLSLKIVARQQTLEVINRECRPYFDAGTNAVPDSLRVFFGSNAIFWYRGYFMQPKITEAQLDSSLRFYKARYIVVGHTIVKWNIASYLGGKVIGVDVDEHKGHTAAALYENGNWFTIDADGRRKELVYRPENDHIRKEDIL